MTGKTKEKIYLKWLDAAKGIAILAVLVDHLGGILYSNTMISVCSYFSVTVFVFLAGITSYYSSERHKEDDSKNEIIRKVKGIFIPYIIATGVYQVVINRRFDLFDCLSHIIKFNSTPPFYFVVFYIQLMIISPYIYRLINHWKTKIAHGIILVLTIIISIICIRYTFILDVWGGGKYLFGGSYLFVFLLGEMSAHYGLPLQKKRNVVKTVMAVGAVIICMIWLGLYRFKLDNIIKKPFGEGVNPPGVTLMLYGGCIVIALQYIFSYIEISKSIVLRVIYDNLSFIGNYSLYIFLYHKVVLDYFLIRINISNVWMKRVIYIVAMIGIPILIKKVVDKIYMQMKEVKI